MELDTQMTTQKWIPPWMTFPHQHSFSISNEKGFVSSWLQCAVEERDGNNGEQNCLASLLKNSFFKNNEMELRKGIGAVPKQCYPGRFEISTDLGFGIQWITRVIVVHRD
jgi:hypothetical protein